MQLLKKISQQLKTLTIIGIIGSIVLIVYSILAIPLKISKIDTASLAATCQNNIKSIVLSEQCGDKSFRSATFECKIPSASNISNQINANSCNTIDNIYNLAKKACGNCIPPVSSVPQLLFAPTEVKPGVGTNFTVSLQMDTAGQAASGVGAIILFDPAFVQGVSIDKGQTFANYTTTSIDNATGRLTISAVSSTFTETFTGIDTIAKVTFKAIKSGSSTIKFDYVPGSTIDSNIAVMTGNGDILGGVNSLKVIIGRR